MRFLFYAVAAMTQLEYFLYLRAADIWAARDLPAIHGPGLWALFHLFMLMVVNSITLLLVGIMLCRGIYMIATNVTTIEGWELERHEQLLRRARVLGGYLDGPDGIRVKIERHEYPYDIGIWTNMRDSMGTSNILSWFWPFAGGIKTDGMAFETNGFEEPGQSWPPPDPDRMPRAPRNVAAEHAFTYQQEMDSRADEIEAFKQRQQADLARRRPFRDRFDAETYEPREDVYLNSDEEASGEEGWADSDGNRLQDYGVEEDAEFYDDLPLAELLRRRKGRQQ